jgi:hypothetical protein
MFIHFLNDQILNITCPNSTWKKEEIINSLANSLRYCCLIDNKKMLIPAVDTG